MPTKSIVGALAAGLFATTALAQTIAPVGPGWGAFAGCWEPIPVEGQAPASIPKVCLIPSGANGADLVSLDNGTISERTHIEADGRRHDVARQGCAGWESASFSADGRRLYLDSEQLCAGNLKRKASGVFALAQNGQWINIVNVASDGGEGLRVSRYTPLTVTSLYPAEIVNALEARALSDRTARVAAQARVTPDAVIEASKFLNAGAVQAWIAELDQTFSLDEKTLIKLADGGVAPTVIDVMVAVSNPKYFAVNATGAGASPRETAMMSRADSRQRACASPMLDPWGYNDYDPCDPYRRYGYYGSRRYGYGYNPYSGYGYGYDPYYGYGSNYGGYGRPVVIIVRGSDADPLSAKGHGRMTKDGYVSDSPASRGASTSSKGSSGSTGSTSGGSTSGGSTSGGSTSTGTTSTSSGSGERTATRKPPTN